MGSIDQYIFRTTLAGFVLILVSLTGVIWITQALRGIDLMTSQGQTILTFVGVTSLAIPVLVLVIAPVALMIAVAYTLTKLSNDSEIIVMNAAGMSPLRLFRPFLFAAAVVAAVVALISFYVAPDSMRRLKRWDAEITADVLTNVLAPGRFSQLDANLTIRIQERQPGGLLSGIFIDDRRDPAERSTIVAHHGSVLKNDVGSFLVLENGNLQKLRANQTDPAIIVFDRTAFDMSKFSNRSKDVTYGIRERYLWELPALLDDPAMAPMVGALRAEWHERLATPFYTIAFAALGFAFLGSPRTTRQSRSFAMTAAITAVFTVRLIGFALSVSAAKNPISSWLQYLLLAGAIAVSLWMIGANIVVEMPPRLLEWINRSNAYLMRLFGRPMVAAS